MDITFVSVLLGGLALLYFYVAWNYKYWQRRGIICANGGLPGLGHLWEVLITKKTRIQCFTKIYNANKNRSMVGLYNFTSPTLMIIEPALVKAVLQTNFSNFQETGLNINPEKDPLLANNPFFNSGEKWSTGRKRLTYAFSSMRLKVLLEAVKQVCEQFENFLDKKLNNVGKIEMETKDLFARFTAQVVANAGFGVNGLCFDENQRSFYDMGKTFLEPSWINNILFNLIFLIPKLGRLVGAKFLPEEADRFFRTLVEDVVKQRRAGGVKKNDFLQLMVELEQMEGDQFDVEILASHAVSFFIDGYETSSSVLSFVGYQLAAHPEVQEKLREEVTSVLSKYDDVITYDALKEMTYLEQVINESQRIIPVLAYMNRVCTKAIELKGSDGLTCHVETGTSIIIPVYNIQHDSRYWDKPDVYDPERFNPDRKGNIDKFTFLPFGEGPRMCVGMRMAMLQMKACLAMLVKKYKLEPSPKTRLPLKFLSSTFLIAIEGGTWINIQPY